MSSLKDRARAFEAVYARKQELEFIVNMKACQILAKWIAEEKLNLKPRSIKRYCDKVLSLSVRHCGTDTMFEYIQTRLKKNNIDMSDSELNAQYLKAVSEAKSIWQ